MQILSSKLLVAKGSNDMTKCDLFSRNISMDVAPLFLEFSGRRVLKDHLFFVVLCLVLFLLLLLQLVVVVIMKGL